MLESPYYRVAAPSLVPDRVTVLAQVATASRSPRDTGAGALSLPSRTASAPLRPVRAWHARRAPEPAARRYARRQMVSICLPSVVTACQPVSISACQLFAHGAGSKRRGLSERRWLLRRSVASSATADEPPQAAGQDADRLRCFTSPRTGACSPCRLKPCGSRASLCRSGGRRGFRPAVLIRGLPRWPLPCRG